MWGVSRSFRRVEVYRDPMIGTKGTVARISRGELEMGQGNVPERPAGAP